MMPLEACAPRRDLFGEVARDVPLDDGGVLLGGFALPVARELIDALIEVAWNAPFRHLVTPGGWPMSVAMTNCGSAGWVSDHNGYR
jgi:alkylated DNA repair protein (DNA oxidative demethylase)